MSPDLTDPLPDGVPLFVRELQHSPELRQQLARADVILGCDRQGTFLVHGRDALGFVVSIDAPQKLLVVRVELDAQTDDLDYLLAWIQVLKGVQRTDFEDAL